MNRNAPKSNPAAEVAAKNLKTAYKEKFDEKELVGEQETLDRALGTVQALFKTDPVDTKQILAQELRELPSKDQQKILSLLNLSLMDKVDIQNIINPLNFNKTEQYVPVIDTAILPDYQQVIISGEKIEAEIQQNTEGFQKITPYVKDIAPNGTAILTTAVNPINISTLMQEADVQKLYIKKEGGEWQEVSEERGNMSGAFRVRIGAGDIISFINPIQKAETKNESTEEKESSTETISKDYVVINTAENLRDPNSRAKIRAAQSGERFKILDDLPASGKYEYKLVESETGEQFRLCVNDNENVSIQTAKSIGEGTSINPPEVLTENIEAQTTFDLYKRSFNSEMDITECETISSFSSPPRGYTVEKSDDPNSFQAYLENYPISEGDLKYDQKTADFLKREMGSVEKMNKVMGQIKDALWTAIKEGTFYTERVGKKYLGNNFSNNELSAMVAGWIAGVDIREVNYFKTTVTDGKLNLNTLDHQDCVDSCLRLNIEYLLTQGDYKSIQKMGCNITAQMSTEQIDKELLIFFQTTDTCQFSRQHHEIGDYLSDGEITEMVEDGFEMNVGDYITFNDSKDKRGGHTVLVMAKAQNNDGERVYRIATSTLPATDMALYQGWVSAEDLLGGGDITNLLASVPMVGGFVDFFADTGIKSVKNSSGGEHTISIGNLNSEPQLLANRNTQKSSDSLS